MLSTIIAFIMGMLKAIPILSKYFPATTSEQKTEDALAKNQAEITKIETTGRP
ncbi:MAG: hypothetical protein NVS3B3_06660 [Aquirhabdus sp.]